MILECILNFFFNDWLEILKYFFIVFMYIYTFVNKYCNYLQIYNKGKGSFEALQNDNINEKI